MAGKEPKSNLWSHGFNMKFAWAASALGAGRPPAEVSTATSFDISSFLMISKDADIICVISVE